MAKNLYDLLEVNQSASPEAITAGYKRLHSKFSDQASNGNEDTTNQLIALREAYSTLSDSERRRRYDDRLATIASGPAALDKQPIPFLKLLVIASVIGVFGVGYAKYQSDQVRSRLERERAIATAKLAEVEAQKEREDRQAAEQAELQRRRDEANERATRERDIAYGNQVSRNLQRAEAQSRSESQREEQQRANAERQQIYEANRQLEKDKAYVRKLEAENSRNTRF